MSTMIRSLLLKGGDGVATGFVKEKPVGISSSKYTYFSIDSVYKFYITLKEISKYIQENTLFCNNYRADYFL